jgi:hypothetical protein
MELLNVLFRRTQVVVFQNLSRQFIEDVLIVVVDETVPEDAVSLVHVQSNQVILILNAFSSAHCHALDDLAHIAQVERIMTLSWRG